MFINALSPIFFRLSGKLTALALQPTNALLPISVTPSGITMSVTAALSASPTVSLVLPNATSGISFNDFEITIFSAKSVPLNAPVPSFVTEFGRTMDVNLALRNAELPIDSSPSGRFTLVTPYTFLAVLSIVPANAKSPICLTVDGSLTVLGTYTLPASANPNVPI